MEFTRDLLQKLERNVERAKGMNESQARAELARIGIDVDRARKGDYSIRRAPEKASHRGPKREP